MGLATDGWNVERVLFSDTHGDSFILNVLPDNVTSGIMTPLSAGHVPATAEACGYTGAGLRAWKASAAGRTYYLYDGSDPVAELDANGTLQATNTFGAQGLVSRHTTATNRSVFYAFDERGNVAQRLDAGGSVLSTDLYDAFGARTSTAPPSDPWGFGAQWGYQTDAETGLVLCTNRFYDPQQGRFLTRDPIGYDGGINLYSYTANNPVNGADPSGLLPAGLLSKAECTQKYDKILRIMGNLQSTINEYNPATDQDPHPIYKSIGGKKVYLGMSKPGSHYRNILKSQQDLKNAVLEYDQRCRHNNNDGNPNVPIGTNQLMLYRPAPNVMRAPTPPRRYPGSHMQRCGDFYVFVPGSAMGLGPVAATPEPEPEPMPVFRGILDFGFE